MKNSISAVVAAIIATAAAFPGQAGISGSGGAIEGISGSGVELLVVGPVEAIDIASSTAIVLGQRVTTAQQLNVGDTVAVFGKTRTDGTISAAAIQARGPYVAGATPIFLAGIVQKAQPNIGRVEVSGITVDLTSAMAHGVLSPAVGSKLAISGTQPVNHGLVVVDGISGSGAAVSGISGSGGSLGGISGSGGRVNGISGSGAAVSGISGSGGSLGGISGSGGRVNGISGSGAAVSGISGSGGSLGGISGSGGRVNGISGSGAAVSGISGSGGFAGRNQWQRWSRQWNQR